MEHVKAFFSGFISVLTFHQGVVALLFTAGLISQAPYNLQPTPPFQVPSVISLAFWGGVWGIVLWPALRGAGRGAGYWVRAAVIGAVAPSLVALFIVFPLKGLPFAGGWKAAVFTRAFLVNGTWGIGVALFMRLAERAAGRARPLAEAGGGTGTHSSGGAS